MKIYLLILSSIYLFAFPVFAENYSDSTIWQLQIKSSISFVSDDFNYAGFASDATEGYDSFYDYPEPPVAPGNYITTYFYHPDWNPIFTSNFARDIRGYRLISDTVITWRFEVKTNVINDSVKMSFINDRIPTEYAIYLKDSLSGQIINLRLDSCYNYHNTTVNPRVFFLLIGDETNMLIPPAPVLFYPLNNSVGLVQPITLIWEKNYFSHKFNLQVSTDSTFSTYLINDSNLTDTVYVLPSLLNLTNYYWRVSASNLQGTGTYSETWKFKTLGEPSQVQLFYPLNNETGIPVDVTFLWFKSFDQTTKLLNPVNGKSKDNTDEPLIVSKYWFELSADSLFASVITRDSAITDTTRSVIGLSYLTDYFWRVKSKNEAGWGSFSEIKKFTTVSSLPIAPVLVSPFNNSTGNQLSLSLIWNKAENAISYRLHLADDSTFTNIIINDSTITDSVKYISGLSPFKKYYWRVNASGVAGSGPWSEVWNFRTMQNLILNLRVYLEGFWDGTTQIPDTVKVYLANDRFGTPPFEIVDSCKILLSAEGTGTLNFIKCQDYNYYIIIVHRNHIETWSRLPQVFAKDIPVSYNFTTAQSQAYGYNMVFSNGAWCLYGGDINQDGFVDGSDMALLDNDLYNYASGYIITDVNGDGFVDGSDMAILDNNLYNYISVVRPGSKDVNQRSIILKPEREQNKTIWNIKQNQDKIIKKYEYDLNTY